MQAGYIKMSEIPQNEVSAADLATWYQLQEQISKLKSQEALLRAKIFRASFPTPKEGTNSAPLNDGTGAVLKATHVVNRTVDVAALTVLTPTFAAKGIQVAELTKTKVELVISEYRKLTAEQRQLFDQALTVKDGSPQMEIVIPKAKK